MKRMRAQTNCAQYAPFGLLLMLLVELQNPAPSALHVIGMVLVLGRAAHGYGFSASPPKIGLRVGGTMLALASFSRVDFLSDFIRVCIVLGPLIKKSAHGDICSCGVGPDFIHPANE